MTACWALSLTIERKSVSALGPQGCTPWLVRGRRICACLMRGTHLSIIVVAASHTGLAAIQTGGKNAHTLALGPLLLLLLRAGRSGGHLDWFDGCLWLLMEGEVGSRRSWIERRKSVVGTQITKRLPTAGSAPQNAALWVSRFNALKTKWWVGLGGTTNQNLSKAESAEHEKLQSVGFNQPTAHRTLARKLSPVRGPPCDWEIDSHC